MLNIDMILVGGTEISQLRKDDNEKSKYTVLDKKP